MPKRVSQPIQVTLPSCQVHFTESRHSDNFRMKRRGDPYHKLIYVLNGQVAYRAEARPEASDLRSGDLVLIPAGEIHEMWDHSGATLLLLCLGQSYIGGDGDMQSLWATLVTRDRIRHISSERVRRRLEALWRAAIAEISREQVGGIVSIKTMAAQVLILLTRLPTQTRQRDASERLSAVVRQIDETFFEDWSIDRAATEAGLSRRRLTDLFRRSVGKTFGDYLSELRLRHAARLLRGGEHSILGVVFACGFNDVSNFYRVFRRRYGVAPGEWLR